MTLPVLIVTIIILSLLKYWFPVFRQMQLIGLSVNLKYIQKLVAGMQS